MGAVSVTFGSNTVTYAARTFTISAPTSPTWYYITVADATQSGEGSSPSLTATCQTSDALVGVSGNTFIGAIQTQPAGGATNVLAGGWPTPTDGEKIEESRVPVAEVTGQTKNRKTTAVLSAAAQRGVKVQTQIDGERLYVRVVEGVAVEGDRRRRTRNPGLPPHRRN